MSEPDMIERVARAIQQAFADTAGGQEWTGGPITWNDFTEAEQDRYRQVARAAIAAMRELSEAMVKAGVRKALSTSLGGDYRWPDYIADLHRIQIDAALGEPKSAVHTMQDAGGRHG